MVIFIKQGFTAHSTQTLAECMRKLNNVAYIWHVLWTPGGCKGERFRADKRVNRFPTVTGSRRRAVVP